MKNKYDCDAYDSGYCYVLARCLTDEEDDMCEDRCCYRLIKLNEKNNDTKEDFKCKKGIKNMKWFEFDQNNSGGRFVVNDKVCHRLFIQAESFDDAVEKAEELGCYWDGVDKGIDCSCCGDRWSRWNESPVNIEKYNTEGYKVGVFDGIYSDAITRWNDQYGKYEVIENPTWQKIHGVRECIGKIRFRNIEEYAQYLADEYGWTTPDARIYYHNGNVKEIFNTRCER